MHLIEADNLRAIAIKTGFCHIVVSYIIFSGRLDAASAGVSALNGSEIGQATQYWPFSALILLEVPDL